MYRLTYCVLIEEALIMTEFRNSLPVKLYELIERNGISTTKEILTKSVWDIKKATNLRTADIHFLKNKAAEFAFNGIVGGSQLTDANSKVPTGISQFDDFLEGGFRRGTLTEIYGESGSGKTQLCITAALHNWDTGVVYICTEDSFPLKRFDQIKLALTDYDSNNDYGNKIFIEHVTEQTDLISCIKIRLPTLLATCQPSLIFIDSIAAPFRSDYTNYIQRAQDLREAAISLIDIARCYNLAVICVNQVSSNFDNMVENVIPCLGLAWSNVINTRIKIGKTRKRINIQGNIFDDNENDGIETIETNSFQIREMSIIFSPELPNKKIEFIILPSGLKFLI